MHDCQEPLSLWLVKRIIYPDYDEHVGFVVIETSEGWARQRAYLATSDRESSREKAFLNPMQVTCERLGTPTPDLARAGVLLSSFRAG